MSSLSARDRWIFEAFMNAVLAILLLLVNTGNKEVQPLTRNTQALMVELDRWKNE